MKKLPKISAMLTLAAGLLCPPAAFAQMELKREPEKPTADAWEFTRYGTHQPSLYTGAVNIDIPLYTYRDKDFEIPISLTYSSNGYKPSMQPGIVGMGWHLNAGGYITREVRGVPDEWRDSDTNVRGLELAKGAIQSDGDTVYVHTGFEGSVMGEIIRCKRVNGSLYEMDADVYRFSFMGHTGEFQKNLATNEFCVYHTSRNRSGYRVKMEAEIINEGREYALSEISIITEDGYTYCFGRMDDNTILDDNNSTSTLVTTERKVGEDLMNEINEYRFNGSVAAWKLTFIKAPNGRRVEFRYREEKMQRRIITSSPYTWTRFTSPAEIGSNNKHISSISRTQVSYLYDILVDGKSVLSCLYLEPSARGRYVNQSYSNPVAFDVNEVGLLLSGMVVAKDTVRLSYKTVTGANNNIPFLSRVDALTGSYRFEYDTDGMGPAPYGSLRIDHYGFLTGGGTHITPLRSSTMQQYDWEVLGDYTETFDTARDPSFEAARWGMLSKITYPTGGYSVFDYEARTYGKRIVRNKWSFFEPFLIHFPTEEIGGGVRVRSIKDYDASGKEIGKRSYRYVTADSQPSGIELHFPRYQLRYQGMYGNQPVKMFYISYLPLVALNDIDIEYTRVEETLADGSKKVYHFENYETLPNLFPVTFDIEPIKSERLLSNTGQVPLLVGVKNVIHIFNILTPETSKQAFRGRLLKEETYACGRLIRRDSMRYTTIKSEPLRRVIYVGEAFRTIPEPIENRLITFRSTMQDGVEQQTEYTYNEYGQVEQIVTRYPDGRLLGTKYTYPDRLNPVGEAQQAIVDLNYMNYPLTVERWENHSEAGGSASDVIVERIRIGYTVVKKPLGPTYVYPTKIEKLDLQSNTYYTDREYRYNEQGDITEVKNANGICTSFVWNRFGPVMRIDNASNAAVEALEGCNKLFEGSSSIKAETIRKGLPNAAVSLYEYDDYGNLIAETDPSGKTTRYDYDGAQRLTRIRDDEWNPVKKYFYSTATQTNTVQQ